MLCVLPIVLGFFIRQRYVNSLQYAVKSFIGALENKNVESLRNYTTAYSFKSLIVLDGRQPFTSKNGKQLDDWSLWMKSQRNLDPLHFTNRRWEFEKINERPFVIVRCSYKSVTFVFASAAGQWKMICWNRSDVANPFEIAQMKKAVEKE